MNIEEPQADCLGLLPSIMKLSVNRLLNVAELAAELLLSHRYKAFGNFPADRTVCARSRVSAKVYTKFLGDFVLHLVDRLLGTSDEQLVIVVVACHS